MGVTVGFAKKDRRPTDRGPFERSQAKLATSGLFTNNENKNLQQTSVVAAT